MRPALAAVLVTTAAAFVALALAAHAVPYFAVDLAIMQALQAQDSPTVHTAAALASWPGYAPQSNVVFGSLILFLVLRKYVVEAIGELFAAGGSALLWFALTPLVNRPRPSPELVEVSADLPFGSFPSGHVLNLTAALGFAWYLAYTLLPPSPVRTAVLWLVPVYLLVLSVARVFAGQHWPSDVLGGILLGALWLWLSIASYRWLHAVRAAQAARLGT